MARPKKVTQQEEPEVKESFAKDELTQLKAENEKLKKEITDGFPDVLDWSKKVNALSPEQFLNSKGIDPAIKSSPIQNITFIQLCELLNEYKNA